MTGQTEVLQTGNGAHWTQVLGSERLTGALLDRQTHNVQIIEMSGDSYRLQTNKQERAAKREE